MVALAGDPQQRVGQHDPRTDQPGEPGPQMLLQCLRLCRTDVVGAGAPWHEKQQAERKVAGAGARPGPPRRGVRNEDTASYAEAAMSRSHVRGDRGMVGATGIEPVTPAV